MTDEPSPGQYIRLRESQPFGRVLVLQGHAVIYSDSTYAGAARYVQRTFKLSDMKMASIYRAYREEYDSR